METVVSYKFGKDVLLGKYFLCFQLCSLCREANGVVIVYDSSNRSYFESLEKGFAEIKQDFNTPILLVANKSDLYKAVSTSEGQSLATAKGIHIATCANYIDMEFIETCAVTGENVVEAFKMIARKLKDKAEPPNKYAF